MVGGHHQCKLQTQIQFPEPHMVPWVLPGVISELSARSKPRARSGVTGGKKKPPSTYNSIKLSLIWLFPHQNFRAIKSQVELPSHLKAWRMFTGERRSSWRKLSSKATQESTLQLSSRTETLMRFLKVIIKVLLVIEIAALKQSNDMKLAYALRLRVGSHTMLTTEITFSGFTCGGHCPGSFPLEFFRSC